jgi:hypothetical protein
VIVVTGGLRIEWLNFVAAIQSEDASRVANIPRLSVGRLLVSFKGT